MTALLILFAGMGIAAYFSFKARKVATLKSPDNAYQVRIWENPSLFETQVLFEAEKEGRLYVDRRFLYGFDGPTPNFLERFSDREWIHDSTLRLSPTHDIDPKSRNRFRVHNDSAHSIKVLTIDASSLFVIFDLRPEQKIEAYLNTRVVNLSIKVSGEFDDGGVFRKEFVIDSPTATFQNNLCFSLKFQERGLEFLETCSMAVERSWE